jgi:Protein of unknown function (DUF3352)
MPRRALPFLLVLALAVVVAAGCGGTTLEAAGLPESASLAPADALVYATVTTDEGSDQWQRAESLLERIPGARDGLTDAIASALTDEGLTWDDDVAPALGPEVVVVVTQSRRTVVLTQPDSDTALEALLAKGDRKVVTEDVSGWSAVAERASDLTAYRAALEQGTLPDVDAFAEGFDTLPEEGLARVWVDAAGLSKDLGAALEEASSELDLGLEWLAAAVSAEDDGLLATMGIQAPGGADTSYEPELFRRVPADAAAALSFGGTQAILERIEGGVDVDGVSARIEQLTGISLDGLVDGLSGEGALYVRRGGPTPEVTLALDPPDPDKTWETLDRAVRKLADAMDATVSTATENGLEVRTLSTDEVTISYARLDDDTLIATTGAEGIRVFTSDDHKLVDADAFTRAAEDVGLEERTKGFVYVDVDGLLALIDELSNTAVPPDAREPIESLDSFILQASGEGDTTRVSGFVRVDD